MRTAIAAACAALILTSCSSDDEGASATSNTAESTTTTAHVVTFTDRGVNARSDCNSVHLAYFAAIDNEPDAALDYLHPDELRSRGTFDAVSVAELLDDPSAARLRPFVDACTEHGYPAPASP